MGGNEELWNFLLPHINPILSGKGHNDNMRRSTRNHFELPNFGPYLQARDNIILLIFVENC
jgi:hypothetical protein